MNKMTGKAGEEALCARVILHGIAAPYRQMPEEALVKAKKKLKQVGLNASRLSIAKRSVDARKKTDVTFVYSVSATLDEASAALIRKKPQVLEGIRAVLEESAPPQPEKGSAELRGPVVVVGFGPCGMFCALELARAGYNVTVVERGDGVEERKRKVDLFLESGTLDPDCNVQFGAGGAGTFSDGKLVTRINDPLGQSVLEAFCDLGAPRSILTLARPHIGTDLLLGIVKNASDEIARLGGRVLYRTKLEKILTASDGRVYAIETNAGQMPCGALVLAIGHSARDTYKMLLSSGAELVGKDFSVGARVEHLQSDIDRALYGDADLSILGHAEYSLSYREGDRGVYSFCMCPGGEVICSSSADGELVVNGMSNSARDGRTANAAIAVSVLKSDYGGDPMKAIAYQRQIERAAFAAAGGSFTAPIQTLGDFLSGKSGSAPARVRPTFRKGKAVALCDLHGILPPHVTAFMEKGFARFERQIEGFAAPDALLTGVETRTSAPLRILRGEGFAVKGHDNLYPGGEGAGYAGGITSAAVDGLRIARAIIARYKPS